MKKLRLLAGLLCAVLQVGAGGIYAQEITSIEELFEYAETHSSQLRPFITAQAEADKEIEVALTKRLPEISATMSVSYIGDGFTTKRNLSDYQKAPIPHLGTGLSIDISQPVYTGGAITGAIELARLNSTAARLSADLRRDNLRLQITGFYLDIYKCNNLKQVLESNIESARKILSDMQARYEQGTVLLNDITRYELLLANLDLQLTKINNTIEILNNNLVTVTGLPENTKIKTDSMLLTRSLPTQGENWWQQECFNNSPSLKLARVGIDISRKAEDIVKSDRLPKIGLQAKWTMDGPILVEIPPINRNLSYWFVGVGVSYNISSLYKNNKALSRSRISTVKATEEYAAAIDNADMAIRSDYIKYMEAYEELKTQEKSVELAERNYHVVSTRYQEGMALITDLLDATDSRINSQQQLVNARIDIIYNYYKLLFNTGKI